MMDNEDDDEMMAEYAKLRENVENRPQTGRIQFLLVKMVMRTEDDDDEEDNGGQ
jgi:hypothetical protein